MKISLTIKQLIKTGIHIGHQKNRWNTKMSSNILGIIKDIHILNIEETIIMLRIILNVLKEIIINRRNILIINNNIKNIDNVIKRISNKNIKYYTDKKWINGYLTNKINFVDNKRMPELLIIYDINNNLYAIKEANKLNIPIISIVDSNNNPALVTYPIPGNNESIQSMQLITNLLNNMIMNSIINEKLFYKYKYNIYKVM
jgi:small subunit ribosomal protein S2